MKYLYFLPILIFITNYSFGQLTFKNNTSEDIYVAIKYPQDNEWITSGWYKVAPNKERTVLNNLTNQYYYYYVTSTSKTWSGTDSYSWIHPTNAFKTSDNEIYTTTQGYKRVGLKKIDTGSSEEYTVNIESYHMLLGDKKYECTDKIFLPCSKKTTGLNLTSGIYIIFTKNDDGSSYMIFQTTSEFVVGDITIYLDNESTIKLHDKNWRYSYTEDDEFSASEKNFSVYYVTPFEVDRIENSNIAAIRYKTSFLGHYDSSIYRRNEYKTFFIHNKKCQTYSLLDSKWHEEERVQFNVILSDLFN